MRTESYRCGQAMIEMAIGMLVFMLILSGLLMFGEIIPKSMHLQSVARYQTGYEAQGAFSGTVDGSQIPHLDEVLAEPEVLPAAPDRAFTDAASSPFQFRMMTQTFSVELDPIARQWYWDWDGKNSFHGMEECYMPIMKIPEFSMGEALP